MTRECIRFVLDGETIELYDVDPTRTVLQFLREDLRRNGSKEGCAEGDCGACTVVLAEVDADGRGTTMRAVNSCIQFLPTLDGKQLITVESLTQGGADLHPVQQAMVEQHGSQCGFCTPGFVMSLFALYESGTRPSRREIDDALAGNLCRCTGYRPIIDAALAMHEAPGNGVELPHEQQLHALTAENAVHIEARGRHFFAPRSVQQLAELYAEYPQATLLAGGTDVGLWVTKQQRELAEVIYTGRVDELQAITRSDTHIEIGAAATLSTVIPRLLEAFPGIGEMLMRFASTPIRNVATLGGNIANGSPIGDSMPALMVLDTVLLLRSSAGQREVALDAFYHGYQQNDLQPGEFIEKIRIPLAEPNVFVRSYKVSKRFDQDISALCAAFSLQLDKAGRVCHVRVAYGGLAATVRRARHCEAALQGRQWSELTVEAAKQALLQDFSPISDMRASASYRQQVAGNLLQRFYLQSRNEAPESVYAYGR